MESHTVKIEERNHNKKVNSNADVILSQILWDSPEAKCWFGSREKDEIVENTMFKRIQTLKQAYTTASGWIIVVNDNNQTDMCTAYDI